MAIDPETLSAGQVLPPLTRGPVTHTDLVRYAGASGDFNPLHTDAAVGQAAGMGGVIAHGMFVMGFAARYVTGHFPLSALRQFAVRFVQVTRLGEPLTVTGRVASVEPAAGTATCELTVTGAADEVKLNGQFTLAWPSTPAPGRSSLS